MIKKLRWKFTIYAELSIFALLAIILVSINVANFVGVASNADQITLAIANGGGQFDNRPDKGPETPGENQQDINGDAGRPDFRPDPTSPDSPETKDSTRFFTVKIDANGSASLLPSAFKMNAVSDAEAIEWAKTIANNNKGWTRTYYRYRTYQLDSDPGAKYVTVIDQGRELSPSYRVLWASIIGSAAGLGASFIVLIFTSKRFVKPLEISDKKQKRFISDASHELKTPLTIISANAELIEMESGKNEHVDAIEHQVGKLTVMIRELNELARIEELDTIATKINVADIAAESFDAFKPAFEGRELKYESSIPDSIIANTNENAIRKLLSIILENASKYALSHVRFEIKEEGNRVIIVCSNDAELTDDGPMDRVFERFYRSDEMRGKVEGSGIGLSIAKGIVERLKGRIYAKAKDGEFIIKIEL